MANLAAISAAVLVFGVALWSCFGNPPRMKSPRTQAAPAVSSNSDFKYVSEQSPYMRTER
jgi:hypothetical protein